MDMNFIHCNNAEVFNKLIEMGLTPLKNDYPFVLLNEGNINFEEFGDAIEISDKMLF